MTCNSKLNGVREKLCEKDRPHSSGNGNALIKFTHDIFCGSLHIASQEQG